VVVRRGQLSKNLKALMGKFQALTSATGFKRFQSALNGFRLVGLHLGYPLQLNKNDLYLRNLLSKIGNVKLFSFLTIYR
jgi:hypothetical protein